MIKWPITELLVVVEVWYTGLGVTVKHTEHTQTAKTLPCICNEVHVEYCQMKFKLILKEMFKIYWYASYSFFKYSSYNCEICK